MSQLLQRFSIRTKLLVLTAISVIALLAIGMMGAYVVREKMFDARIAELRALVETANGIAGRLEADVKAGRRSQEEATALFRESIHGMRYNAGGDYLMAYDSRGFNIAHGADAKIEGADRSQAKDTFGKFYIREMMDVAAGPGEGVVSYNYPKPGTEAPLPKLTYVKRFGSWDGFIATGVYVDDIEADFHHLLIQLGIAVLGLIALAGGATWVIGRDVSGSLARLQGTMQTIAAGNLDVAIDEAARKDEIGVMAGTVQIFRDGLQEANRLRVEQEQAKINAAAEQKASLNRTADGFESSVGGIVGAVASAATEMRATAESMSTTATHTHRQVVDATAAAEQATSNVQTVSAATQELSSSISEIGRQVAHSAAIASQAVEEAGHADKAMNGLTTAAQKIGAVISLIQDIAGQTNLLALNATIEAARAGDAGRGFAVVASEVKALATQTAGATEEISSQIAGIQSATEETVGVIRNIGQTIGKINEIATTIASAVEEQNAATQEIARNVHQAAEGTQTVMRNIAGVKDTAEATGAAASQVLGAAGELSKHSERLTGEVGQFLAGIRAG